MTNYLNTGPKTKKRFLQWRALFSPTARCPKCFHDLQIHEWGYLCTTPACGFKIGKGKVMEIYEKMRLQAKKKNSAWTEEDDSQLVDLYNSGKKIKHIARELGRTQGAVYARLYQLREEGKINGKRQPTNHETQNPKQKTELAGAAL